MLALMTQAMLEDLGCVMADGASATVSAARHSQKLQHCLSEGHYPHRNRTSLRLH